MKKWVIVVFTFYSAILCSQEQAIGTSILWDTSLSMEDRLLEKDFSVLQKVFERQGNQEVQLILFNIDLTQKTYTIKDGNWEALKTDLQAAVYDGASNYRQLKGKIKHANVYVFTDGQKVYTNDVLELPQKSFIVNSSPSRDADFLKRTALITRSRLMDFAAILPENMSGIQKKQVQEQAVSGTVYIDNKPAPNVNVAVKGIATAVVTDSEGNFKLSAKVGDSLLITSRSDHTLKTVAVDTQSDIRVFMKANVYALEEVVLVEKIQKEALTQTGYGLENKEKVGYATQSIGDDEISPIQTNVSQSIQNRFSGVNLGNSDATGGIEDISKVTMRSNTSLLYNLSLIHI